MDIIRLGEIAPRLTALFILLSGSVGVIAPARGASDEDVQSVLQKANAYIETAKLTERAVESWERYQSWVNMKSGPTGKERYISYGLYDVPVSEGHLAEARAAAGSKPSVEKLDAAMTRYLDAYEALFPVMNKAAAYYDGETYKTDNIAGGKALHKQLVPLATKFLAERDAMMPDLRVFVREVEAQELAALAAREGRSVNWLVAQVMHTANGVFDVFPRTRPQPMSSEMFDAQFQALGPDTPGDKFDELISGVVKPENISIDVKRFGDATESYAAAVEAFDRYSGEKPEDFDELKPLPRQLLDMLRLFQKPLIASGGRDFENGGQMAGALVQAYFDMSNAASPVWQSQLRYLP